MGGSSHFEGYLFEGPHSTDFNMLESILGFLAVGKAPDSAMWQVTTHGSLGNDEKLI